MSMSMDLHPNRRQPRPTQVFHRSRALPLAFFRDSLRNSTIGGAHFGGVDPVKEHRLSLRHHHDHDHSAHRRASTLLRMRAEEVHSGVLADLKDLFECRPSPEIFERRFARNAVFEDPYVLCRGVHEVAPQFFSLAHVMSKSTTISRRVLSQPSEEDTLIYAQKQEYVLRFTGRRKIVDSVVRVELDADGRITRLVDEWHGHPPSSHWIAAILRRLHARLVPCVPWLASAPRSATTY